MKTFRFLLVLSLFGTFFMTDSANAQKKPGPPQRTPPPIRVPRSEVPPDPKDDFSSLYENAYSGVEEPFVLIVRDSASYTLLGKLLPNFNMIAAPNFEKEALIAAFAGTKPTGGYGIAFTKIGNAVKIETTAPSKGAMTTDALTTPVRLIALAVENDQPLNIQFGKDWKFETFRVTGGEIEMSGGFAPKTRKYQLSGTVKMLRAGDWATFVFDLTDKKSASRKLVDAASASVNGKSIEIWRLDAGALVDNPHPPLKATGELTAGKMKLNFESLPSNISDGYEGKGWLTAAK